MITIIPAIDIIDGKCVRLSRGEFDTQKVYERNPLEVAKRFEDYGIRRLHLVDLDGARARRIVNRKILEAIATKTALVVDFGGGVQTEDDLRIAFESGAAMITAGSIAVKEPDKVKDWLRRYGARKIILGADVKQRRIAVHGWQEESDRDLFRFLEEYLGMGITQTICTDVERDGMLAGPAFELYGEIQSAFPGLQLIASGGVGDIADIIRLNNDGINGVIIGKAIYEGRIQLAQLKEFLC